MANEQVLENQPDLAILMLYSELRNVSVKLDRSTVQDKSKILNKILERSSDFYKSTNVLARIIGIKRKDMEINDLQESAEKHLFTVFQQEAGSNVNKFMGNGFYTLKKIISCMSKEERQKMVQRCSN